LEEVQRPESVLYRAVGVGHDADRHPGGHESLQPFLGSLDDLTPQPARDILVAEVLDSLRDHPFGYSHGPGVCLEVPVPVGSKIIVSHQVHGEHPGCDVVGSVDGGVLGRRMARPLQSSPDVLPRRKKEHAADVE
jgi:hypothetical protein